MLCNTGSTDLKQESLDLLQVYHEWFSYFPTRLWWKKPTNLAGKYIVQFPQGGSSSYPCHCACIFFLFVGQIELYTHIPVMKQVVDQLQKWNFRLCAVFLLDSQFLIETSKFFAGAMTALSAMVTLELPHVNVLSKMDLLDKKARIEVQK